MVQTKALCDVCVCVRACLWLWVRVCVCVEERESVRVCIFCCVLVCVRGAQDELRILVCVGVAEEEKAFSGAMTGQ